MRRIKNPIISAYLQTLLLTGARREEMTALTWEGLDLQWKSMIIHDKVEGERTIPLTPYVASLLAAGLPHVTLHGLRRSFGTLAEWVECPTGITAQIMGHKPSTLAEKHYRRRPLDLLRMWHTKIEAWMLEQAGIEHPRPEEQAQGLRLVK